MSTSIDRALAWHSKSLIIGFGVMILVATGVILAETSTSSTRPTVNLPAEPIADDSKGDPSAWSVEELRAWLEKRYTFPPEDVTKEQLVALVKQQNGQ